MTVAQCLADARQAHIQYRLLHHQTQGSALRQMAAQVQLALQARCAAEQIDPAFTDPAWAEDMVEMKASHDALVTFYAKYLTPPAAFAQAV